MTPMQKIMAKTVKDGACQLWTGGMVRGTYPRMYAVVNGKQTQISVRRVVWNLHNKGELAPNEIISMRCENDSCLNHRHMERATKADAARRGWAKPGQKMLRSMAALRIVKNPKLDIHKAREMRARLGEGAKQEDVAQEFDVSQAMVSRVAMNQSWKDYSTPWAGLGART